MFATYFLLPPYILVQFCFAVKVQKHRFSSNINIENILARRSAYLAEIFPLSCSKLWIVLETHSSRYPTSKKSDCNFQSFLSLLALTQSKLFYSLRSKRRTPFFIQHLNIHYATFEYPLINISPRNLLNNYNSFIKQFSLWRVQYSAVLKF